MTERLGIRIEKCGNCGMGSFPDTAAPVIERIFRLEKNQEFES
jgi:hypothetical protein